MDSWHSYSSVFNLGHRAVKDLLSVPVIVEEKIDGSQFSFGVDEEGTLYCRSKGAIINVDAPEKMFGLAVETALSLQPMLHPGWTYRGEYLRKPKHNALTYGRVPKQHVILFDINTGLEEYADPGLKKLEADRLGLECVPFHCYTGPMTIEDVQAQLDKESVLGGTKIEGVVIKPLNYDLFGQDKKVLMGKYVSEVFKEVHQKEWKGANPSHGDIIQQISERYKTEARWAKAVQHLRENGLLENSPKDIGRLITEVPVDIDKECREEIVQALMRWAWPRIRRKVVAGLAEWYKQQLLQKQFETYVDDKDFDYDGSGG